MIEPSLQSFEAPSARIAEPENAVTARAAIMVLDLVDGGYRGLALLRDPGTRNMLVFRAHDDGVTCLAFTDFVPDADVDASITLVPLPRLQIADGTPPTQVFQAVEAELRRMDAALTN